MPELLWKVNTRWRIVPFSRGGGAVVRCTLQRAGEGGRVLEGTGLRLAVDEREQSHGFVRTSR
ncbi:MAG: hypothetical protein AUH72_18575 [Acidobacteria bacterium 13_1_40CM_4_65_8]|nr:MAG: hypothetical protein AUH72_18575 [Acidobacteria bacterium 13_1_40CM_4_65_8]